MAVGGSQSQGPSSPLSGRELMAIVISDKEHNYGLGRYHGVGRRGHVCYLVGDTDLISVPDLEHGGSVCGQDFHQVTYQVQLEKRDIWHTITNNDKIRIYKNKCMIKIIVRDQLSRYLYTCA